MTFLDDLVDDDPDGPRDDDSWTGESWDDMGFDRDVPDLPSIPLPTPDDVLAVMLALVGPERFGPPMLWFLVLDADDRPLPLVLPIGDLPTIPDPGQCADVVAGLARIVQEEAPGGAVAVAYVRAQGGDRGEFETRWNGVLTRAAARQRLRLAATVAIGATRARVLG